MKNPNKTYCLPIILWLNALCDWDTALAADMFENAVNTLDLWGKPLTKDAALEIVNYVQNICKNETGHTPPPPVAF